MLRLFFIIAIHTEGGQKPFWSEIPTFQNVGTIWEQNSLSLSE
jgi:hypothetical protein